MKRSFLLIFTCLILNACAPVLSDNVFRQGIFNATLSDIRQAPVLNKGKLYIMGGVIVKTTVTKKGSLIEAIYVPVNSRGYLKSLQATNGRFLALYKSRELLDPLIFQEKREITFAGEFIEMHQGKIGEMEYDYPFFEIKEIYLWPEIKERDYYRYPPPYYSPWPDRYRYYNPYYPWWYY